MGFLGVFAISRVLLENLAENGTSHSKIVGSIILYLCSSLAAAGGVGEERIHRYIYISFCLYLHHNNFSFSRLFFSSCYLKLFTDQYFIKYKVFHYKNNTKRKTISKSDINVTMNPFLTYTTSCC